jgi:predicted nucleic acid-binding protein
MRAVDTNVLVRLITRDDPKQVAAAESFVTKGAWVSHVVLAETLWVLESVYELGAARHRWFWRWLERQDSFPLEPSIAISASSMARSGSDQTSFNKLPASFASRLPKPISR